MTAQTPQVIAASQLLGVDPENLLKALNPAPERMLSVSETACRLGMGTRTIWRYIRTGRITAKRIGPRRVLIAESDLRAFVKDAPAAARQEVSR